MTVPVKKKCSKWLRLTLVLMVDISIRFLHNYIITEMMDFFFIKLFYTSTDETSLYEFLFWVKYNFLAFHISVYFFIENFYSFFFFFTWFSFTSHLINCFISFSKLFSYSNTSVIYQYLIFFYLELEVVWIIWSFSIRKSFYEENIVK